MIVAAYACHGQLLFKMREVDTEEEAFYEMRRFIKVNGILSETTSVHVKEFDTNASKNIGKAVGMGGENDSSIGGGASFFIYYDDPEDKSVLFESIQDARSRSEEFEEEYQKYLEVKNGACVRYDWQSHKLFSQLTKDYYNYAAFEKTYFDSWFPERYEKYLVDLCKRSVI